MRLSNCCDEDVCLVSVITEVGCSGVRNSNNRIAPLSFLHQYVRDRLSHNVAAADNYNMLARGIDVTAFQQFPYASGCARIKSLSANHHPADIDGMKSIHIFLRRYCFDDFLLVDVFGKGELYEDTVNFRIAVEGID